MNAGAYSISVVIFRGILFVDELKVVHIGLVVMDSASLGVLTLEFHQG